MMHQKTTDKNKHSIISKVVKNQQGQLLMKYGQAYFPLRSIEKSKVSQRTKSLLNSYPCWFIKQSLIRTKQFKQVSNQIISADPKQVYVFQQKQHSEQFFSKNKILASIDGIKFTYLKVLHIMLMKDNNFEEIGWLNAPVLEELYVSTQGCFTSLKPLQKNCFKQLYMLNFRTSGQNNKTEPRMFCLEQFYRTKLLNYKNCDPPKAKIYTPPGTLSICRMDLSNINYLAKLQIQRLTNFHVPHLQLQQNQNHRFTPNAEYPWCPQLQFSQTKLYKSLNNRFDNKTIALSIIDYVFGQVFDDEREFVEDNTWLNDDGIQEQYEEIDSDLDKKEKDLETQFQESF